MYVSVDVLISGSIYGKRGGREDKRIRKSQLGRFHRQSLTLEKRYRQNDGKREEYIHVHKASREFFSDKIHVYPHQGAVAPGEYNFPFSYQLPSSLPGSFYEEEGRAGEAYIAQVIDKMTHFRLCTLQRLKLTFHSNMI